MPRKTVEQRSRGIDMAFFVGFPLTASDGRLRLQSQSLSPMSGCPGPDRTRDKRAK